MYVPLIDIINPLLILLLLLLLSLLFIIIIIIIIIVSRSLKWKYMLNNGLNWIVRQVVDR